MQLSCQKHISKLDLGGLIEWILPQSTKINSKINRKQSIPWISMKTVVGFLCFIRSQFWAHIQEENIKIWLKITWVKNAALGRLDWLSSLELIKFFWCLEYQRSEHLRQGHQPKRKRTQFLLTKMNGYLNWSVFNLKTAKRHVRINSYINEK